MTPTEHLVPAPRFLAVRRRRRPFGLDAPRPRDRRRIEADVRAWIARRVPAALVLRLAPDETGSHAGLVVLLPGRRIVVFSIDPERTDDAAVARLAEACRCRGILLAPVSHVDDARAVLRRCGVEPEER